MFFQGKKGKKVRSISDGMLGRPTGRRGQGKKKARYWRKGEGQGSPAPFRRTAGRKGGRAKALRSFLSRTTSGKLQGGGGEKRPFITTPPLLHCIAGRKREGIREG